MTVRSPKTEHHPGKGQRVIPITPKLMEILQDAFDQAEPGQERVVTKSTNNLYREFAVIIKMAGVTPWANTFQTLRTSCEIQWAQTYPQFAVSRWVGHSIAVSGKHYANHVPDELFDQAAGQSAAYALQKEAETARIASKIKISDRVVDDDKAEHCEDLRELSECRHLDSNQEPRAYESLALTT